LKVVGASCSLLLSSEQDARITSGFKMDEV
jgi:hypothetical protein